MFPIFDQIFHRVLAEFFIVTPGQKAALDQVKLEITIGFDNGVESLILELTPHPAFDTSLLVRLARTIAHGVPVVVKEREREVN
jgi:hypothetical protein